LQSGEKQTGCSIHVVDAGVDTGPVIRSRQVDILPDDNQGRLHERIKIQEQAMLVEVVRDIAEGKINLEDFDGNR